MQLYNGSSGADVKKMQEALIAAGYDVGSTGADGIYGQNTQRAVRQYQQDNGLSVDGIAGDQTLGRLYQGGTAPTAPAATGTDTQTVQQSSPVSGMSTGVSSSSAGGLGSTAPYSTSADAAYQRAIEALRTVEGQAPSYDPGYDGQLAELYQRIVSRPKFNYDLNADMLYKQYRQQYTDLGRLAMQDTMGQAAGLTGGYGSSYGQAVGQQQYDAYLQRLNDVIPDLYDRAYNAWLNEGDDMLTQYQMLGDLRDDEYGRYQDAYSRWLTERDYAQGLADQAYQRGLTEQDDARDRIYTFLAAGGSLDALDPSVISASGLTPAELSQIAAQYQPAYGTGSYARNSGYYPTGSYDTTGPGETELPEENTPPAGFESDDEWLQYLYDTYGAAAAEQGAGMISNARSQILADPETVSSDGIPYNATIDGLDANNTVYVARHGRLSLDELSAGVQNGEIQQVYDAKTNTVHYYPSDYVASRNTAAKNSRHQGGGGGTF